MSVAQLYRYFCYCGEKMSTHYSTIFFSLWFEPLFKVVGGVQHRCAMDILFDWMLDWLVCQQVHRELIEKTQGAKTKS